MLKLVFSGIFCKCLVMEEIHNVGEAVFPGLQVHCLCLCWLFVTMLCTRDCAVKLTSTFSFHLPHVPSDTWNYSSWFRWAVCNHSPFFVFLCAVLSFPLLLLFRTRLPPFCAACSTFCPVIFFWFLCPTPSLHSWSSKGHRGGTIPESWVLGGLQCIMPLPLSKHQWTQAALSGETASLEMMYK